MKVQKGFAPTTLISLISMINMSKNITIEFSQGTTVMKCNYDKVIVTYNEDKKNFTLDSTLENELNMFTTKLSGTFEYKIMELENSFCLELFCSAALKTIRIYTPNSIEEVKEEPFFHINKFYSVCNDEEEVIFHVNSIKDNKLNVIGLAYDIVNRRMSQLETNFDIDEHIIGSVSEISYQDYHKSAGSMERRYNERDMQH